MAALAIVPVLQGATGRILFAGDAWMAAIYVLGFGAAIVVAARAQDLRPGVLPSVLFASLGLAALVSVGLALAQWLHLRALGTLLFALPDNSRLTANLGQPNHLATLLVWGLLAIWWGYVRGRLHRVIALAGAALLLFGVAMTQSRAAVLELVLLVVAAFVFRRPLHSRRYAWALAGLGMWFAVAVATWTPLNEWLQAQNAQSVEERLAPGTRLLHWRLLIDAAAERAWAGWGWNQVVLAQVDRAPVHPASHEVVQYSHNLVLDLILWNGVPIGVLAGLLLAAWVVWQARLARTADRVLLLLGVGVLLVHALLELPHGYALFLVPAGLMVGSLSASPPRVPSLRVPRAAAAVPFSMLVLCVAAVLIDYAEVEQAWMAHRFRSARIGSLVEAPVPRTMLLSNLEALLRFMRIEPQPSMSPEELEFMGQVSRRQPSAGGLFRYARALALNGRAPQATDMLVVLCRLHPDSQCAEAKRAWMAMSKSDPTSIAGVWPDGY